ASSSWESSPSPLVSAVLRASMRRLPNSSRETTPSLFASSRLNPRFSRLCAAGFSVSVPASCAIAAVPPTSERATADKRILRSMWSLLVSTPWELASVMSLPFLCRRANITDAWRTHYNYVRYGFLSTDRRSLDIHGLYGPRHE